MRITIVCGAGYVSGKEIMAMELGEGLLERGDAVELVVSFWNNGEFIRRLKPAGLPFTILPIGFISATLTLDCLRMTSEQMLRWPGLLVGYRRFLQEKKPCQVVHTNWHHLLLLLPFLNSERDLFWLHEVVPDKPQYRRVFRSLQRRLKCFVPVSHAVAASLRRIGISDKKIRVIHNGMCDPVSTKSTAARPAKEPRIGIVGQIGAWKGHEDLLAAFGLLIRDKLEAELHVFGAGANAFEAELKRRAEELGISQRTFWHGFVADRSEIFNQMDICVVPSRSEDPLPTVAIEAGFFGLPVVASHRGGLPEIVRDGQTGFLVEACRPDKLVECLRQLVANPELRTRIGEQARQNAMAQFGVERFLKDFKTVLDSASSQ